MLSPFYGGEFRLTSVYGERFLNGKKENHHGIDLVGISSKKICSISNGIIVVSQMVTDKNDPTWEWGNYVAVMGDDKKIVYYCHLSERIANVGERVSAGSVIGIEGNTGYSFGSHLHLEVRDCNNSIINSAEYIGIPNKIGTYKMGGNKDLEKRLEQLESTVGENYNFIYDLPEWAKKTIEKLKSNGVLKGDENENLGLSYQMIRILVILDRSGIFDSLNEWENGTKN